MRLDHKCYHYAYQKRQLCEKKEVLINLIVATILQHISVSNYHILYLKLTHIIFNNISINLEENFKN